MAETLQARVEAPAPTTVDAPELHCEIYRDGEPAGSPRSMHDIKTVFNEPGVVVWFDVVDPGPEGLDVLRQEFDLHPLAVEDATHQHERPKIEAFPSYWLVIVQGTTVRDGEVEFHEMAIFANEKFVVTVRHSPPYPLDDIKARWMAHAHQEHCNSGDFLLYTILDTVVDGYLPVSELIQDRADALEEGLFEPKHEDSQILPDIFHLKQEGRRFRHAALPMRDILNPIIRGDRPTPQPLIAYFRDIYDHTVLVMDQLDNTRDMIQSALDIHVSVVANKQNEVMKQLAIIATIFLPLTFITGFFGQNFAFLVGDLAGEGSFWLLGLGTLIFSVLATIAYFRLKRWF